MQASPGHRNRSRGDDGQKTPTGQAACCAGLLRAGHRVDVCHPPGRPVRCAVRQRIGGAFLARGQIRLGQGRVLGGLDHLVENLRRALLLQLIRPVRELVCTAGGAVHACVHLAEGISDSTGGLCLLGRSFSQFAPTVGQLFSAFCQVGRTLGEVLGSVCEVV